MLRRAFGPLSPGAAEGAVAPLEGAAAVALARRFEVAARLADRMGREWLAAELGEAAARELHRDRLAAAAAGMRLLESARAVAAVAAELGIPLVLLKFVALDAAGVAVVGRRDACDIDLLAPPERAAELHRALREHGFAASPGAAAEHQLPALAHPLHGAVEIHRLIPGVRPDGRRSATVASLAAAGLCRPVAALPGEVAVPAPAVLAAHLLVHGLVQHGYWPDSYSLLKMVADLIDLRLGEDGTLARAAAALVARDLAAAEVEAAADLCRQLAAGAGPAVAPPITPAGRLLAHILAGRLDRGYEQSLRLGVFRPQPSDRPEALRLLGALAGTVFLSRAQVDAIYGKPRRPLGYLGRQIGRPFDLLWRLGRYGARRLAVKRA